MAAMKGFFEHGRPNKKDNKMSSDMRSVPGLKLKEVVAVAVVCEILR